MFGVGSKTEYGHDGYKNPLSKKIPNNSTYRSDKIRVSYETNFDSKQSKLEPKLVSTLSETRRLFRYNIETWRFGVSIEPKQTENNRYKSVKLL
jgi:hypothetical protein